MTISRALVWRCLLLGALVALGPARPAAGAEDISGPATIIDGDTLTVAARRLRLEGIDAPALGTPCRLRGQALDCGHIAKTALMDLTVAATVVCRLRGTTAPDGTPLGACAVDGYDLSEGMLHAGWARAAGRPNERYDAKEAEARHAGRGMWHTE